MQRTRSLFVMLGLIALLAAGCAAATPEPTEDRSGRGPYGPGGDCALLTADEVNEATGFIVEAVSAEEAEDMRQNCYFFLGDDGYNLVVTTFENGDDAHIWLENNAQQTAALGDVEAIPGPWDEAHFTDGFGVALRVKDTVAVFNSMRNHADREAFVAMSEIIAARLAE